MTTDSERLSDEQRANVLRRVEKLLAIAQGRIDGRNVDVQRRAVGGGQAQGALS